MDMVMVTTERKKVCLLFKIFESVVQNPLINVCIKYLKIQRPYPAEG